MHSPHRKPRRRLTRKEKGNESDRRESDSEETGDGSSKMKSASTEKASTSANERLRSSTHQKNPVVRFGYNEYMAHYYAYMTHVA